MKLLSVWKSRGCNCWLIFALIPFEIIKIFRLIFGWYASENGRSKRYVAQRSLGTPDLDYSWENNNLQEHF
jgi:hypothetical protein